MNGKGNTNDYIGKDNQLYLLLENQLYSLLEKENPISKYFFHLED